MKSEQRISPARAGFTLIELLAVILIVGILATVLISQLGGATEAANIQSTRGKLAILGSAMESYEYDKGDYPPSSFTDEQGVANDGVNVGIEAMVVAMWSDGYEAGHKLDEEADRLVNTDNDSSGKTLTDFGTRGLFELADAFGNPLAYFHRRDYEVKDRDYITFDLETGEELHSFPKAFFNEKTGRFYNRMSYQLISAGQDALFGTEDDITAFDRE